MTVAKDKLEPAYFKVLKKDKLKLFSVQLLGGCHYGESQGHCLRGPAATFENLIQVLYVLKSYTVASTTKLRRDRYSCDLNAVAITIKVVVEFNCILFFSHSTWCLKVETSKSILYLTTPMVVNNYCLNCNREQVLPSY